ncbi:MAG TPA: MFS transporter [Candidatus Sulfotelmatobacter sp.]|nr:MFS transporter [Candidatus Sulfotelmatobacter sp.]
MQHSDEHSAPGRRLIPLDDLHLIALLAMLLHAAFAGVRVCLSLFALSLGASPLTVGAILSLLALLPTVFSVPAGRGIDRIGVRPPLLAGTLSIICGTTLAFVVPRLEILFLVSAFVGSGFMLAHIAVNHIAGELGKAQDRTRNFSLLALAFSTSGFLGPMTTGFAIDRIGHRSTFLLLGGFAMLALAGLLVRRIEIARHGIVQAAADTRRLSDLLSNRTLRYVLLASGVLSPAWDLFTFVVPIHGSQIGLSATQIGLILGAFGAAIFCVRLMVPLLLHRVSEWQMLIAAMLSAGVTYLAFPLVHGMPLLLTLAFILGIGLGGSQPMIMSLLYSKAPAGRGAEAVGVRSLILNVSQTGMPLMFGGVGEAVGMTPVFWTMAACLLGSGYIARRR